MRERESRSPLLVLLTVVMVLSVAAGCVARCTGLDRRVFWADEVVTSLRVAGYTIDELKQRLFDGHAHTVAELNDYQTPGAAATPARIAASLAAEDAQHPPLYYLLERAWVGIFGNAVAVRRSLSAVCSILALPALYWLCIELSSSRIAALIAVGIAALSPFFEIYAKQAREYSLWELLTLVGGATVVRAAREPARRGWWIATFAAMLLAGYTFLFGIFGAVSGVTYVALRERLVWNATLRGACAACGCALLGCLPWIVIAGTHASRIAETNAWSSTAWPLPYLLAKLGLNLLSPFYDLPLENISMSIAAVPLALFLVFALWTFRTAPRDARLFAATLAAPTLLFVILPDIVMHTHRSSVTRYLMPLYLTLQIVTAFVIAELLTSQTRRRIGGVCFTTLLAFEAQATVLQSQADLWWDNQGAWPVPQIEAHLPDHAVTIVDETDWPTLFGLMPHLAHDTRLMLGSTAHVAFSAGDYLLSPSPNALTRSRKFGLHARSITLVAPLQRSAHAIGRSTLMRNSSADDATFTQLSKNNQSFMQ